MTGKRGLSAAVLALVLVGAITAFYFFSPQKGIAPKAAGAGDDPVEIRAEDERPERRVDIGSATAPNGAPRAPIAAVNPFSHLPRTRDGFALESDPFLAESVEEQRWLDRHGYPNAAQYQAYSVAPDGLLQQAAASGDHVAGVFLDSRKLMAGDTDAAGRLLLSGSKGSSFALTRLQAYMAGAPNGDRVLAYALARVIEMKGDSRAALVREGNFATPITMDDRHRGELVALQIFDQFQKSNGSANLNDPRPIPLHKD